MRWHLTLAFIMVKTFVLKYEIYKDNLTMFEPEWVAGLNARLDIFKGGEDYDEYKAYSKQVEVLDLYIQSANNKINMLILYLKMYIKLTYHLRVMAKMKTFSDTQRPRDIIAFNTSLENMLL